MDIAMTIPDGTQITYQREDSGQILDGGFYLVPGEILTVGQDVPAALAQRLVEDHVCAIVPPVAPAPAAKPSKAAPQAASESAS